MSAKNFEMPQKPIKAEGGVKESEAAFLDGFKGRLKSLKEGAKFAAMALGETVKGLLDKKTKNKKMLYMGLAMATMSANIFSACRMDYNYDTKMVYPSVPERTPSDRGHEKHETLQELYNDLVDIFPEFAREIDEAYEASSSVWSSLNPETGSTSPETGSTSPETGSTSPETGSTSPDTSSPSPDTSSPSPEDPDLEFRTLILQRIIGWMPPESTNRVNQAVAVRYTMERILRDYQDESNREKADALTYQLASLLVMDENIEDPVATARNIIKSVMVEVMYGDQIRGE